MFRKLIILGLLLSVFSLAKAQNSEYQELHETYDLDYRTFRVTLAPGLSTNGLEAKNYASRYSFNILAGYNGALDRGFELGGLLNINRYYAHGGHIAGLGNYSGGELAGIGIGGLFNYSGEELQGIQFAGVTNIGREDIQGIQFAGTVNWAGEMLRACSLPG